MGKNKNKNKRIQPEKINAVENTQDGFLKRNAKDLKDLIKPAGIDCSHSNHVEIISSRKTRYI